MIDDGQLILAAEDCDESQFSSLHCFTDYEDRIIKLLMAHGPVLLRGGRGSGKSALLIEASRRIRSDLPDALPVYLSLRHLPLLQSSGIEYQSFFSTLVAGAVNSSLEKSDINTRITSNLNSSNIRTELVELARKINKRIVLIFDDAAHIGRETDLGDFFGLFRTISGNNVSCKAAIYPGVTKFGKRFDVYSDATVIDLSRDERSPSFSKFFSEMTKVRYPKMHEKFSKTITSRQDDVYHFLGRSVLGNARSYVFACNILNENNSIGLNEITDCLTKLSADYYWPLLEELRPKLGIYESLLEPSQQIAESIFDFLVEKQSTSALIHRDYQQRLLKVFEILEYVGFISKREASRSLRSGGRGARYASNLCTLLEKSPHRRVTQEVFQSWVNEKDDAAEIHSTNNILNIEIPLPDESKSMSILEMGIDRLKQGKAYPYGLTDHKLTVLKNAGINTIADLAKIDDKDLLKIPLIGDRTLLRVKNTVLQAIWM